MSLQFGQKSFTVSNPGKSERPQGTTLQPLQYTRGQEPKTPASYLSTWIQRIDDVSRLFPSTVVWPLTIACSPALVKMYRWWQRPYNSSADASTIETSGILEFSSSYSMMLLRSLLFYNNINLTSLHIQHHLHLLLPEWNHNIQPSEIEVVFNEVFCHFAEVFVTRKRAEPADPCERRGGCRGA